MTCDFNHSTPQGKYEPFAPHGGLKGGADPGTARIARKIPADLPNLDMDTQTVSRDVIGSCTGIYVALRAWGHGHHPPHATTGTSPHMSSYGIYHARCKWPYAPGCILRVTTRATTKLQKLHACRLLRIGAQLSEALQGKSHITSLMSVM